MAHQVLKVGVAKWAFDSNDSTTSAIDTGGATMKSNFTVPIGTQILGAWTDAKTSMTSDGSAQVAIAIGGVTIKAATAMDNSAYVALDFHLARTAVVLTTTSTAVTFIISAAALTAGVVDIYVEYILPD